MPRSIRTLSGYEGVWLFAMFDLPMVTKAERKAYAHFRKSLIREGFMRLQYSVYARYCPTQEASEAYRRRVRADLPPKGQVRLIHITDRQFGQMSVFAGKNAEPAEDPPAQLMLF